jgi:uncharacterized protein (DUF58 family)
VSSVLRENLDWGRLVPLRLKALQVADGVYAGTHRSPKRGSGVEFGGHRNYVPGDDLRFMDRHALMRHGRLMIREFETETDRSLRLMLDASESMAYRSETAPAAKLAYGALIAAALARVALSSGDPVALDWIGGDRCRALPGNGGREAFDRIVGALEDAVPAGDLSRETEPIAQSLTAVSRHAARGAVLVLLSDLLDLPRAILERFATLATRGRTLVVVRLLDPLEAQFSFDGPVRLRSAEGDHVVETDAAAARDEYLAALEKVAQEVADRIVPRGGRLVRATTNDDPVFVVRAILAAARGEAP